MKHQQKTYKNNPKVINNIIRGRVLRHKTLVMSLT